MTESIDALVIVPGGAAARYVALPGADRETLAELYRLIGCDTVEVVALRPEIHMWVDEDGLAGDRELNLLASYVASRLGRVAPIVGPAVLTGGADSQGGTMGLSLKSRATVMACVAEWHLTGGIV